MEEKEEEQKEKGQKVEVKNLEKDKKEEVWERKWAVMEPNEGQEKEQGEVQEEENEEEEGDKKDAIKKRGWSIEEQEQKTAIPTVTITVPADQIGKLMGSGHAKSVSPVVLVQNLTGSNKYAGVLKIFQGTYIYTCTLPRWLSW